MERLGWNLRYKEAFQVQEGESKAHAEAAGRAERWLVWGPGFPPAWPRGAGLKSLGMVGS